MAVDLHDAIDLRVGVALSINLEDELGGHVDYVPYDQEHIQYEVYYYTTPQTPTDLTQQNPINWTSDDSRTLGGETLQSGLHVIQIGNEVHITAAFASSTEDDLLIDFFYESQPGDVFRVPIHSVKAAVNKSRPAARFPSLILPGNGDSFLMPRADFVEGNATLIRVSGSQNFVAAGTPTAREIQLNSATKNINAVFNYQDTNNNAYRVQVRQAYPSGFLPTTADLATGEQGVPFTETQIAIPPTGELRISRASLVAMLPTDLPNKPTASNIGVAVRQGSTVARYENNLLKLGGTGATLAARHSVGIAITNTGVSGTPVVWAFYWIVAICRLNGEVPLWSEWLPFTEIALAEGQGPDVPERSNPDVVNLGKRKSGIIPPAQPLSELTERPFNGTLPARTTDHTITMNLGEVRQVQTEIHIALQDARRLLPAKVQKLEGGLYDVPKLMNDQYYTDWPVPEGE